jgi:hypothetical protein
MNSRNRTSHGVGLVRVKNSGRFGCDLAVQLDATGVRVDGAGAVELGMQVTYNAQERTGEPVRYRLDPLLGVRSGLPSLE